jgi:hypothetical protein
VWKWSFPDVCFDAGMSNEAPAEPKNFLLSKTLWVNAIALLALLFPAVRDWAAAEPEAPVIILAFVNLVLRSVTSKGVKFSYDGASGDGNKSGGGLGGLPAVLFLVAGLGCLLALPSCSPDYPVIGSITLRDPKSGAKGGLVFTPGEAPRASVRVPVYDPETGELIGMGELTGPLSREISATK